MSAEHTYDKAEFGRFFRSKYIELLRHALSRERRPRYGDPAVVEAIAAGYRDLVTSQAPHPFPRHIFMLWQQGWDAAPAIVRACAQSWARHNPGWALHLLDETSFRDFAPTYGDFRIPSRLGRQARANLARLSFLRAYGGVWADATLFCSRPLDEWLPRVAGGGLFMFSKPRPYRMADIWFIAAAAENPALAAWHEMVRQYWDAVRRPHHYYWMEYLFELLVETDADAAAAYGKMARFSALGPLAVAGVPFDRDAPKEAFGLITSRKVPVHKLSHKWGARSDLAGTPIGALTGLASL